MRIFLTLAAPSPAAVRSRRKPPHSRQSPIPRAPPHGACRQGPRPRNGNSLAINRLRTAISAVIHGMLLKIHGMEIEIHGMLRKIHGMDRPRQGLYRPSGPTPRPPTGLPQGCERP